MSEVAANLDRVDMLVLAAVWRAALGLESIRAVARVARVSPTAAGRSLADDPDAWAWAVAHLPKSSLCKAATARGTMPRRRALIENLIESMECDEGPSTE